MKRSTLLAVCLSLLILVMLAPWPGSVNAADKATETPTPDPAGIAPQVTPEPVEENDKKATPTIGVMILITPTPDHKPPSLQIPDLEKKIKEKASAHSGRVRAQTGAAIPYEIDETIERFWWWLIDRQNEYRDLTGDFCQTFWSHETALPSDGVHEYPDGWYNHPTDQDWSWDNLTAIQYEPLPFAIRIDVYQGPKGPGFIACFRMGVGGVPYERCRAYGAETTGAHGWQLVQEDGL